MHILVVLSTNFKHNTCVLASSTILLNNVREMTDFRAGWRSVNRGHPVPENNKIVNE